jgi:hypothetical protein
MKAIITILFSLICISGFSQTVNDLRPTVTMKEYVDMQAMTQKEASEAQFRNVLDNVNKANASMEKRLDAINEFRGQLKDQAGTFITRAELFGWLIAITGIVIGVMGVMNRKPQTKQ